MTRERKEKEERKGGKERGREERREETKKQRVLFSQERGERKKSWDLEN